MKPNKMPDTLTVMVPLKFERNGGRKTIVSATPYAPPAPHHDNALIKALARAHRWRLMIETGQFMSITELAKAEKINQSYACRLLRMTLLAPKIVQSILDGTQPQNIQLKHLLRPLPVQWELQTEQLLK